MNLLGSEDKGAQFQVLHHMQSVSQSVGRSVSQSVGHNVDKTERANLKNNMQLASGCFIYKTVTRRGRTLAVCPGEITNSESV